MGCAARSGFLRASIIRLRGCIQEPPTLVRLLSLLLFLALPALVQAQFTYTTNNGTITITGYTGPGGLVTMSDTIDQPGGHLHRKCNAFAFSCIGLTGVSIPDSVGSMRRLCVLLHQLNRHHDPHQRHQHREFAAFEYCTSLPSHDNSSQRHQYRHQ